MKVSLTQKIYAGNFLLLAAIVGMVVILFRERSRMREIDFEVHDLQSVRNDIHAAHLHITGASRPAAGCLWTAVSGDSLPYLHFLG